MNKFRQFPCGVSSLWILGDYRWDGVLNGDIGTVTAKLTKLQELKQLTSPEVRSRSLDLSLINY